MIIEDYFDAAFVINLTRRPDRLERFRVDLSAAGINPEFVKRVPGFDHPTHGHTGCTRSHRDLIRRIADGPWNKVLVFEDDCAPITADSLKEHGFTPDSVVWKTFADLDGWNTNQKFSCLTRFIPNMWDVLYLGAGYGEPAIRRVNRHVIQCGFMQTTSSYGITRRFAREWTRSVDERWPNNQHPGPIDNTFGGMAHDSIYLVTQPRIFYQRASKSDITGQEISYFNSMTDPRMEEMI